MDDEGTNVATFSTLTIENDNSERSCNRNHEFDETAHPVERNCLS